MAAVALGNVNEANALLPLAMKTAPVVPLAASNEMAKSSLPALSKLPRRARFRTSIEFAVSGAPAVMT